MSAQPESRVTYRACHLCEALCGLEIRTEGERIVSIKGDHDDPFSRGHICPKAIALQDVHDRSRSPARPGARVGSEWKPIAWDDAFTLVAERFADVQSATGPTASASTSAIPTRTTSAAS
jgi:anaerobic selenocysteine-containing dehydrogenase